MRTYTFEVDGNAYTLKFGYNAICELEELCGNPVQEIFKADAFGFNYVRSVLLAGLRWKFNGMTKQQVGFIAEKLVEAEMFDEVIREAVNLLANSVGITEVKDNESVGE